MTETRPALSQLTEPCPAPPDGCGSPAGQLCTSHNGTRVRHHDVHRARIKAWETSRIEASPAARLVAEAAASKSVRHGSHVADLLATSGYSDEAVRLREAVSARHGHLSVKQALQLLIEDSPASGQGRHDGGPSEGGRG
ncbi:hypothetical protein OG440_38455 (plasmid) [Streptomyces sp. NBC_00637]|uniref:zinc finger domain-containing protein n=1 Tax=Streptomyces sp. NBC_00637 TaxID=2903667 RepID=UPI002F907815